MSRLFEAERTAGDREYIFPCDCSHPDHYLRISVDPDDQPAWRYMWIEYVQGLPRIRDRIKTAWNCLLGRDHTSGEVVLSNEAIESLRMALDEIEPQDKEHGL